MHQAVVAAIRALNGGLFVIAFALVGEVLDPKRFAGLFSAAPRSRWPACRSPSSTWALTTLARTRSGWWSGPSRSSCSVSWHTAN